MKTYPAYHLTSMRLADIYFDTYSDARVSLGDILTQDTIPAWDRLKFFCDNADRDVLARWAERVAQIHGVTAPSYEELVDAFLARARKRGVGIAADEALFRERSQSAVAQAVAEAGHAELLAIATLAVYSLEEDASERRYREQCGRCER